MPQPIPALLTPYVKNTQVFICPSDRTLLPVRGSELYGSYEVNPSLLGLPLEQAKAQPFAWDRQPWHNGGRNLLTIGSRPKWMREKNFAHLRLTP